MALSSIRTFSAYQHFKEAADGISCCVAPDGRYGRYYRRQLSDMLVLRRLRGPFAVIRLSIRRKIMGIAIALIVLMGITAVLSMVSVIEVSDRLEELTQSYVPAYGDLARANIRSVERALALRRMVIEKIRSPSGGERFAAIRSAFDAKGVEFEREVQAAQATIHGLIGNRGASGDITELVRLDSRLEAAVSDSRRHLNDEIREYECVENNHDSADEKGRAGFSLEKP